MSIVKYLYLVTLFFSVSNFALATVERSKIIRKQEQILLELADKYIVESYHVLARFYADRSTEKNDFLKKSFLWRIQAAQFGHRNSLYQIAMYNLNFHHYKKQLIASYQKALNTKAARYKEALILISEAAILGHTKAKIDLVMLPKFLPISNQDIEQGIQRALIRLKNGFLINCNLFKCIEQTKQLTNSGKLSQYQLAATNFDLERNRLNCQKLKQCLQLMLTQVKTIDQNKIKQFKDELSRDNAPKVKRNNRIKQESLEKLTASWENKSNMDRQNQRIQAAKAVVDQYAIEDRKKLKTKMVELLEKINYHRDKDNQIKLSEIMGILSQP